jgi:hypothetical protein
MWRTKVCHVNNYDGLVCIACIQETRYVLEISEVFMYAPCTPRFLVQTSHIISLRKVRVWPHEKPPVHTKGSVSRQRFLCYFAKKWKKKFKIKSKKHWHHGFSVAISDGKQMTIARFVYLAFHCVTKNRKRWLNSFTLFLVYSQIWLNLLKDDCHFFYVFQWMIATLATNKQHWIQACPEILEPHYLGFTGRMNHTRLNQCWSVTWFGGLEPPVPISKNETRVGSDF